MAKRKLRLEIQQSDEHGECGGPKVPRWYGQHSITTKDITGSVMKILITDSKGKQIAITIGNNGSIKEVMKNQEIIEEHGISISSINSQIERRMNMDENIHPYSEKNQQSINSENYFREISNSDLQHVKQELKEHVEPATESTISFKDVVKVTSEGYKLETLEPEVEEELHTEIEETRSENRNLAGKFETVYIDSAMLCENDELPKSGQSSETSGSIFQSTNDTTSLCRLCATQRKDMIYIFERNEAYKNIIKKIQDCLPILVTKTDTLPKQVCRLCLEKLEMIHKFHKTVTEAEKQFNNLGEKMSEALKNTDKNVQTSLPRNEQMDSKKHSKKLVSDKKLCSLPLTFKSPEILNNPKESVNKTNTDEEIIFIGEEAVIDDHNEEFDIIKCRICGLFFGTAKSCYLHAEMHNTENYYPCSMCSKILTNQSDSLKHSTQHVAPKPKQNRRRIPMYNKDASNQCKNNLPSTPIANKDNARDNNILGKELVANKTSVENKDDHDMIKCRICGRYFGTAKSCYKHSLIHASEEYMPCSMCDKIFMNATDSSSHSLEHILPNLNRKRAAVEKRKLFNNIQKFLPVNRSSKILNNEKPNDHVQSIVKTVKDQASIDQNNDSSKIRCRFCGCTFPDAKSCYTHASIHVREDYYPCTMCDKTFTVAKDSWRHNLDHILVEEKKKKLSANVCDICGKRYVSEARLKFHQTCHNPKKKACYCEKCDKVLASETSLFYHIDNVHKKYAKEYGCEVCEKRFRNQSDFNSHQIKYNHPNFECNLCGERFYAPDKLILHKEVCSSSSNRKKFSCSHCEETFSYKRSMIEHMKIHNTRIRVVPLPYHCNICPKTYPTYESRNKHRFTHRDRLYQCDICNQKFIRPSTMRIHKRTRHNI